MRMIAEMLMVDLAGVLRIFKLAQEPGLPLESCLDGNNDLFTLG
jgi:hypothetical protein